MAGPNLNCPDTGFPVNPSSRSEGIRNQWQNKSKIWAKTSRIFLLVGVKISDMHFAFWFSWELSGPKQVEFAGYLTRTCKRLKCATGPADAHIHWQWAFKVSHFAFFLPVRISLGLERFMEKAKEFMLSMLPCPLVKQPLTREGPWLCHGGHQVPQVSTKALPKCMVFVCWTFQPRTDQS